MKINNEKIVMKIFNKDGKLLKEKTFQNRILDYGLDWLTYRYLPASVRDVIYPEEEYRFLIDYYAPTFPFAFIKLNDTQIITDGSTQMDYDLQSDILIPEQLILDATSTNIKTLVTNYVFNFETFEELEGQIMGIGFGLEFADETLPYLCAFVDLELAEVFKEQYDGSFYMFSRYDRAESNEISTESTFLPLRAISSDERAEISKITLCTMCDGAGDRFEYLPSDLTWTRLSAGIIEVTGFDNFLVGGDGLIIGETTIIGENTIIQQRGQIMSVEFEYLLTDDSTETPQTRYMTTYVNKEELDISYNDTEFKLKLKVERGDY